MASKNNVKKDNIVTPTACMVVPIHVYRKLLQTNNDNDDNKHKMLDDSEFLVHGTVEKPAEAIVPVPILPSVAENIAQDVHHQENLTAKHAEDRNARAQGVVPPVTCSNCISNPTDTFKIVRKRRITTNKQDNTHRQPRSKESPSFNNVKKSSHGKKVGGTRVRADSTSSKQLKVAIKRGQRNLDNQELSKKHQWYHL